MTKEVMDLILINKGEFFVFNIHKNHHDVSWSKSTLYTTCKICFVLEGDAVWEIDDRIYPVQAGDIIFLNIGQKRQFNSFGENGLTLCAISFERSAFSGQHHFMYFIERIKNRGNVFQNPTLFALLTEIRDEWKHKHPLCHEFVSAKLTEFFLKAEREENYVLQPMSEEHRKMLKIMDYIDANIGNDISLNAVAEKAGLTESTFSRQFSAINGISFKRYVVEKKIQRAIWLLETTDRKMVDIALECGFDSVSGFYSAFKKKTGTTPNKFYEFDV